jgi:hypothetical protein
MIPLHLAVAKRDEQVRLRELAEAKHMLGMLVGVKQRWLEVAAEMKKTTHGDRYDLPRQIPHELECCLSYWSAVVHMLKTLEEVRDENSSTN